MSVLRCEYIFQMKPLVILVLVVREYMRIYISMQTYIL